MKKWYVFNPPLTVDICFLLEVDLDNDGKISNPKILHSNAKSPLVHDVAKYLHNLPEYGCKQDAVNEYLWRLQHVSEKHTRKLEESSKYYYSAVNNLLKDEVFGDY